LPFGTALLHVGLIPYANICDFYWYKPKNN